MRYKLQALSLALLVSGIGCEAPPVPIGDPDSEPVPKTAELKMADGVKISTTTMTAPGQEPPPQRNK